MQVAMQMQFTVGKLAPSCVLKANGPDGFPMTPEEMNWQFEFFENVSNKTSRVAAH
jgi:hypothetical protein